MFIERLSGCCIDEVLHMKILWFTNCAMPAYVDRKGRGGQSGGGWMGALLSAIQLYAPEIKLSVAFESSQPDFVKIDDIDYYALGSHDHGSFSTSVERCVKAVGPDVIHIHGTESIAQTLPDSVIDRWPVVVAIQGVMEECARNYLGGLEWEELKRYRNPFRLICRRPDLRQIASSWRDVRAPKERALCERVRFFMGRTNFDKTWLKSVNPEAHYFHVDEVLRPEFYQGQTWFPDAKSHAVYAGGAFAYPLKGGHWLVRALEIVKHHYSDVRLRVAASVNCTGGRWRDSLRLGEYQRYLVNLARQLNVGDCIDFLPVLSAAQVRRELEEATVYCLTSMMENSPNSLCEAQMVGTPVIATNVGGVSSLVTDNTGRLVSSGDPRLLAYAIMEQFECSIAKTRIMTRLAYEEALQRHEPRNVVKQLIDAYRMVKDMDVL